ncbi:MAG TPA: urate oxidase [Candidatus Caenarcaniphilales bacterium]|nr:urate oxidase [Candidatus Caenarcaniphilales bacterium]
MKTEIYYGKADVATYRTHATPLRGLTTIQESPFAGRTNTLLAADIEVQVLGTAFLAAYTEGDNRLVVATDTMKNFIHRESLAFAGATLEQWLLFIGRRFLETYPHMERLRVRGVEIPFEPAVVPASEGDGEFAASEVLFQRQHGDRSTVELELGRLSDGSVRLADLRAGRIGLQLIKLTGSSFASFARDEYTTLPERPDRPLYVHLDVAWRYADPNVAAAEDNTRYVAGEQIGDLVAAVFHRFVSLSIQHLVHEIGQALLARFPQLSEVSFEAQNRLWDLAVTSEEDERVKVYSDPRPPYGKIGLVLRRD